MKFSHSTIAAAIVLCLFGMTSAAAALPTIQMDAAETDRDGVAFDGYAAVRPIVDNRQGDADLTNVRFKIEIHSGTLGGNSTWNWDDPDNPWYGSQGTTSTLPDGSGYSAALVYYPPTREFAPGYHVDPTPEDGHNDDDYVVYDAVPPGFLWAPAIKLWGWEGSDIELFSTAEGLLASDQLTETLYDSDRAPTIFAMRGDMNGDGLVNGNDINPFVMALVDGPAYWAAWGMDGNLTGDVDALGDGLTGNDINPFVDLLVGGSPDAIPEPTAIVLLAGGLWIFRNKRKRKRQGRQDGYRRTSNN